MWVYLVDTSGGEEAGAGDGCGEEVSGDEEEETKYYLVKWDGEPYMAGSNEEINVGMNTGKVKEGEWLCPAGLTGFYRASFMASSFGTVANDLVLTYFCMNCRRYFCRLPPSGCHQLL